MIEVDVITSISCIELESHFKIHSEMFKKHMLVSKTQNETPVVDVFFIFVKTNKLIIYIACADLIYGTINPF